MRRGTKPGERGVLYLLELTTPLGSDRHRARYYLGWARMGHLAERLARHRCGQGAILTSRARERGIDFEVVLVASGYTRDDERRFKQWHNNGRVLAYFRKQAILVEE